MRSATARLNAFHVCQMSVFWIDNSAGLEIDTMENVADFLAYQKTIAKELASIKDRVRNLVRHWPTDGTFKEEALRQILRRHLPSSLQVGTGFVVRNDGTSSSQIDILIIDRTSPTLFKDGDLLIVTPEAVRGAIEVKSRLSGSSQISKVLDKICALKKLLKTDFAPKRFIGLFVYDAGRRQERNLLNCLGAAWEKASGRRRQHCIRTEHILFMAFQVPRLGANSRRICPLVRTQTSAVFLY